MIHNPGDGCMPVTSLTIIKQAVPAHHQLIRVAGSERGGDGHALLIGFAADAIAVGQVDSGKGSQCSVFARVQYLYAQITASAVKVQCSCLEKRLVRIAVKILEGHKIAGKFGEMADVAHQTIRLGNGPRSAGKGEVGFYQG